MRGGGRPPLRPASSDSVPHETTKSLRWSRSGHSAWVIWRPKSLMKITPSASRSTRRWRLRTAWNNASDGWYEGLEKPIMSN